MIGVRTRRLLLWVALPALLLVLLYTVLGFFVVPRLIKSGAHDFVAKNYHRELRMGDVRFNPFTLRLDIRDCSLPDTDGQPMVSFSHLLVDLTIASIWRLGPDFENILLEQPYTRVLVRKDGTLNLADLALPPSPDTKPEPNPKPVRLFIKRFRVQDGNVAFDDQAHPSAFRAEIKPITFDLNNFGTVGKTDGSYDLSGTSEAGESFSWSGSVSPLPLSSHGKFQVGNLQAQTISNYLRDSIQFELPSGTISVNGEYNFTTATNPIGLSVDVHDVNISDFGVRPKGGSEDYVKLARLDVHETHADVAKRTVSVESVHLAGAGVKAWVSSPGKVNLLELVGAGGSGGGGATGGGAGNAGGQETGANGAAATAGTPGAAATAGSPGAATTAGAAGAPATPDTSGAPATGSAPDLRASAATTPSVATGTPANDATPWVVSVPDIALDGINISAEDRQVTPHVSVQLDDLNVHVSGFTTARTTPVAVTVATKINRDGKLDAKADLSPDFATAKVEADLAGLDLRFLQPYIAQQTSMTLLSGQVSTKLTVERAGDGQITMNGGEINVAKFRTVDNVLKQDFIKVDRLQISGIDYQGNPNDKSKAANLHVHNITAHAPYARVIIESDRTVNVKKVLSGPNGAAAPKEAAASSASSDDVPTATATSAVLTTPTDGGNTGMAIGMQAPAPEPTPAPPSTGHHNSGKHHGKKTNAAVGAGGSTTVVKVDAIKVEDGSANYADFWIQPHFAVGIQGLNGTILGISSDPSAHAKIELNGKVDRYAPVHIWGDANLLNATDYTDIKMSFKGVELTSATPYSGHFAGYKIQKGKLSVDIGYKIEERRLSATHKFVIDQLELGDKVDSPDAVHLPLKLAIALLKDRNGVIDLDLPITGTLDDPKFRIGPIIWKAVLNLLVKAATAPFAALAHLFGGGEQMNFIDFHPGSATLDPSEHDKLTHVVDALKAKEKLELDVPITFSPDVDRSGLASVKLDQQLAAIKDEQGPGHKHGKNNAADRGAPAGSATAGSAGVTSATPGSAATGVGGPDAGAGSSGASSAAPSGASSATPSGASSATPSGAATAQLPPLPAPPPPDPALTDPQQRYHLLVALYRANLGKDTPLPDSAQTIETAKKKDATPPDYGAANSELEAALLQKIQVTDADLEILGKHRARAIQDVLLVGTDIDPSRVFVIGTAPKNAEQKDKVRVELALK